MILKPQDLLISLKLVAMGRNYEWRFNDLALSLNLSVSETHAGIKRAERAGLVHSFDHQHQASVSALEDFLLHGLRYVFVPDHGEVTRGLPTAHAASPIASHIVATNELPPVWPLSDGEVRGMAFSPLYKSAPEAARKDDRLYELLVIVDTLRGGRARERQIAATELKQRFTDYDAR